MSYYLRKQTSLRTPEKLYFPLLYLRFSGFEVVTQVSSPESETVQSLRWLGWYIVRCWLGRYTCRGRGRICIEHREKGTEPQPTLQGAVGCLWPITVTWVNAELPGLYIAAWTSHWIWTTWRRMVPRWGKSWRCWWLEAPCCSVLWVSIVAQIGGVQVHIIHRLSSRLKGEIQKAPSKIFKVFTIRPNAF